MSDGRGKRREKHTHPFFMASSLQLKLQERKETEKGEEERRKLGGGDLFLCSVAYKLILDIFFLIFCPRMFAKLPLEDQMEGFFFSFFFYLMTATAASSRFFCSL